MSDDVALEEKKPGKGKKMILAIAVALIMGSAGIAGGLYAAGAFGSAEHEEPETDPNQPQLVLKGEDPVAIGEKLTAEAHEAHPDEEEKKAIEKPGFKAKIKKVGVALPSPKDPSKYQATYFQMPAPYTSNLADTDGLVQIALAVSTYYDGRVIKSIETHETAIRSEILMALSQQSEMELSTPKGKEALQKQLTALINKILMEKTGYSGVDNVYFTNFVIQ